MEELDGLGLLVTAKRPNPRELEYGDIARLPYLAAVMKEALRMFTPVPMIFRQAKRDLQVRPASSQERERERERGLCTV